MMTGAPATCSLSQVGIPALVTRTHARVRLGEPGPPTALSELMTSKNRPRAEARGRLGVDGGQGESSSRTLPLVSIPNRAVIRPPMSAIAAKARNT